MNLIGDSENKKLMSKKEPSVKPVDYTLRLNHMK